MKSPRSLRFQSALLLVGAVVVITTVFALIRAGGDSINQLTDSAAQIRDFDNHNHDLFDSMVSQQAGLSGYALTGDHAFLQSYEQGRQQQVDASRALSTNPPEGIAGLVSDEQKAAAAWQAWAETRAAGVAAKGGGGSLADSEGRRLFDDFRARWTAVDQHVASLGDGTRTALASRLERQQVTRSSGWFAVMAGLVLLAVVVFLRILRPLVRQSDAALELDGEKVVEIPGLGRDDEIGHLARALDALQTTLRERVSLTKAMEAVGGRAELADVVELGTKFFAEQLDADEAVITLLDGKHRFVAGTFAGLFETGRVIAEETPGDDALAMRGAVISTVDQMHPGEIKDAITFAGYGPFLTLPMVTGGEVVGLVSGLRWAGRPQFGAEETQRAEILAPVIGAATKVARLVAEIREANEVKSRFLANMSHELRTPLNAILGFSQVLAAGDFGPLTERQTRYVGHIESSGGRLLELINDILDLAKVEAGLLEVRPERLELAQLMIACRSEIERLAAGKGVNLVYDLAPGVCAWTEQRRLQQVVINLMTNAVKFTPAGGRVTLATAVAGGKALVTVTDTGVGIAPEEHERIFDEFVQADDDSTREQRGTGLGLSLSRKLTELMGGTLTVESQVGKGSKFTVTLPLADSESATNDGPLALVVEDEISSTELLEVILLDAGYRVTAVSNVAEASEAVRRELPRVVLLDVALPGPDGWTFLMELRAMPSTRDIPVVAVTALDAPPAAYRAHLGGFFTKPVSREALVQRLAELTGALRERVAVG